MATKQTDPLCDAGHNPSTCRVEAVLSIDSRGQVVIPKEVRKRANIRDGDKLALVSWANGDEICCLSLIHADNISSEISGVLHSLIADKD